MLCSLERNYERRLIGANNNLFSCIDKASTFQDLIFYSAFFLKFLKIYLVSIFAQASMVMKIDIYQPFKERRGGNELGILS